MKNILKSVVVKLFYNDLLKLIAKPILSNFPVIKSKLKDKRDSIYVQNSSNNIQIVYENNFLEGIKSEVESRKNSMDGNK